MKNLKPGMKIIFYSSGQQQGYHGEAEIANIEIFNDPLKILEKYKDRLFLTEEEFKEYINTKTLEKRRYQT